MTCGDCRFGIAIADDNGDTSCQRFPPVPLVVHTAEGEEEVRSYWPTVAKDAICGEFAETNRS